MHQYLIFILILFHLIVIQMTFINMSLFYFFLNFF